MNITANDVLIDCQGFAITYNTAGGSTLMGIDAINGANARTNLTIKNCIIQKTTGVQTAGYGIRLTRYSNSSIINNTIYTNGTSNNYGIYLTTNCLGNRIENNTIRTNGSLTGNTGIYLVSGVSNNVLRDNTIFTWGTTTSYGIWISTNAHNNSIQQNAISTYGTAASSASWGIYITSGAENTTVTRNWINTSGTNTNYGIFLQNNVNRTNITHNYIFTNGTATNYGIYLYGTTALKVEKNEIRNNTIIANGNSSSNFGIYLYTNTNGNLLTENNISTNGTTTDYGLVINGVLNGPADDNTISNNTIFSVGTSAAAVNHGIYVLTNANRNSIIQNTIVNKGATTSYGIHVLGTTLQTINTTIEQNNISTTGNGASNHGIYIFNNASNTTIRNNQVIANGTTTTYAIYVSGANLASNDIIIVNNNISAGGTSASNYGIYLYRNVNRVNISNNTIQTMGTTGDYGIYLAGTTALSVNDNILDGNSIITNSTTAGTNPGIVLATNANRNNITNNTIRTNGGTTQNFGIYLTGSATLTVNNNRIEANKIFTNGTTTNIGIYLLTNANANKIIGNSITTNGTSSNIGIYLSGTTATTNNNEIILNNISAGGSSSSNYGIYLYRNVSGNNVSQNRIYTYGTTTNHGIYAIGTAAMRVDNNTLDQNDINATGAGVAVTTYGVVISSLGSNNRITNNNVTINGTTANY
jgi:hypothetical protein